MVLQNDEEYTNTRVVQEFRYGQLKRRALAVILKYGPGIQKE